MYRDTTRTSESRPSLSYTNLTDYASSLGMAENVHWHKKLQVKNDTLHASFSNLLVFFFCFFFKIKLTSAWVKLKFMCWFICLCIPSHSNLTTSWLQPIVPALLSSLSWNDEENVFAVFIPETKTSNGFTLSGGGRLSHSKHTCTSHGFQRQRCT